MRYLVDSHVLLWFSQATSPLSREHLDLLSNPEHALYLSVASVWELTMKRSLGKLRFAGSFRLAAERYKMSILPVMLQHVEEVEALPRWHRDPFDHMLIAQARVEGLILVTHNEAFARYEVAVLRV